MKAEPTQPERNQNTRQNRDQRERENETGVGEDFLFSLWFKPVTRTPTETLSPLWGDLIRLHVRTVRWLLCAPLPDVSTAGSGPETI